MHKITSARFIKGVVGPENVLQDGTPQIAFIGRSNVGKSSTINTLAQNNSIARTSSTSGRTQEINVFLINEAFYLVDLPGYGYAKLSLEKREWLKQLIYWYFFNSSYPIKKVVLIIDAEIGPTKDDIEMLDALVEDGKDVVIVANKIDKINNSKQLSEINKIKKQLGNHTVIPYSAKKKIGLEALLAEII